MNLTKFGVIPDVALAVVVTALRNSGAHIVAVAGNDHLRLANAPAHLPARLPNVNAVESTNIKGNLSCFSNRVYRSSNSHAFQAPGGDCTETEAAGEDSDFATVCSEAGKCDYIRIDTI